MWAPSGRYGLSPSKSIFLYARSAPVSERSERLVVCVPPRPMSGDEHSMARGGHSSQLVHHANADPLHGYTGAWKQCAYDPELPGPVCHRSQIKVPVELVQVLRLYCKAALKREAGDKEATSDLLSWSKDWFEARIAEREEGSPVGP